MIAISPDATIASVFVAAKGRNILPSRPPSAKTGRNDRSIIKIAKTIGRPTCRQAEATSAETSPLTGRAPNRAWRV